MNKDRPSSDGFKVGPKQVGSGLLGLLALAFVLQNTQSVRVNLLAWDVEWPLWIVLVVMFLIGMVVGSLLRRRAQRR